MVDKEDIKQELSVFLKSILDHWQIYSPVVIHETIEALGNIDEDNYSLIFDQYDESKDNPILKETCELAINL